MQIGDEGKGKIVDFLAGQADVVARFSGGANTGHIAVVDGKRTEFSMVPAGALWPEPTLVLTDGVAIEPFKLVEEIKRLRDKRGFDVERLLIGRNAIVTLSYHMYLDYVSEEAAGQHAVGATRWGNAPTRIDQAARQGVRLFEYLDPDFMREGILTRTNKCLTHALLLTRMPGMLYHGLEKEYAEIRDVLGGRITDTVSFLNEAIDSGQRVVFEGAQGALLDMVHGFYPHVTSASTLAGGVCTGAGVGPTKIDSVIGVVKTYSSRSSQGPLPTELGGEESGKLIELGHERGYPVGTLPRVGWLDLVILRYAAKLNGVSSLALTRLDALDPFDEIKVCVAYKREGQIHTTLPADLLCGEYEPVYETLPGWKSPCTEARSLADLPAQARSYLHFIEDALKVPVGIVSVGRERSETFYTAN
jgi:adenylosuccinate synthase